MQGKPKPISTLEDLVKGNFIQTPSVMFRSQLFEEFPNWYFTVPLGDWPLHVLNARHGNIGYIDEVMGVYRVHSGGRWSSKSKVDVLNDMIDTAEKIKESMTSELRRIIECNIIRWYLRIIEILSFEKDFKKGSSYARKCLFRLKFHKDIPKKYLMKLILRGDFPWIYNLLAFLRNSVHGFYRRSG